MSFPIATAPAPGPGPHAVSSTCRRPSGPTRGFLAPWSRLGMILLAVIVGVVPLVAWAEDVAAAAAPPSPGIDIASYQHPGNVPIEWTKVRRSGIKFAYIKATEGSGAKPYGSTNAWFTRDWAGAGAAGIARGAYHFAQPRYPLSSADADARRFVALTGPMNRAGDLAPVLDLEISGGLSSTALIQWTQRWIATMTALTGRKPIIYTGYAFWKVSLKDTTVFNGYQLWMARYQSKTPGPLPGQWTAWKMWQFGTTRVPGIRTLVDADVMCMSGSGCVVPVQKPATKASTTSSSAKSSSSTTKTAGAKSSTSKTTTKSTTSKSTTTKYTTAKSTTAKSTTSKSATSTSSTKEPSTSTSRSSSGTTSSTKKTTTTTKPASSSATSGTKTTSTSRR